jgi:hypothetical protein
MSTMLLDQTVWDLVADASGNIALATDPYAIAQNVASACQTFLGECWYNTLNGVPYWEQIFGQSPPLSLIKAELVTASLTVPGCSNPVVFLNNIQNRTLTGQIQFTGPGGTQLTTTFSRQFILGRSIVGGGDVI